MLRDLLRVADLSAADLELLLDRAASAAADPHQHADLLRGDTVALDFATPPTRLAFQTAVAHLGGTPLALGPAELQRARGETIQDAARVISRYVRAIVVRTVAGADLDEVAAAACVPVVNALSDRHDPCQTLAGLLTLRQRWGRLAGRKLADLGGGGNVAHSLLEAAALAGMDIAVATPYGLEPHPEVVARARALAAQDGSRVELTLDPTGAVRDADAVVTDAWLSMHDPASARAARIHVPAPFRVDRRLLGGARPDALFLHCLPAYRGEEATDEVIDGPRSLVLDPAANLLPIAQALLYLLLEGRLRGHTDTMTVPDDSGRLAAAITAAIKGDAIGDQLTSAARLRSDGAGQDHRPRRSYERSRTSLAADSS